MATRKCGHQDDGDSDALVVGTCDALDHDQFCSNFGRSDALADSARYADLTPSAGVDGSLALPYGCDYVAGWFRDV